MQQYGDTSVDWGQCIVDAARHFRGEPNPRLGSPRRGMLRWGSGGSLVVYTHPSSMAGTFCDFEATRGGGVLTFLQHEAGMDRSQALAWLRERGLMPPSGRPPGRSPPSGVSERRQPSRPSSTAGRARDTTADALRLWTRSAPVPGTPEHPARLWLAHRHLWRSEFPLPGAVRWLDAGPRHQGAGSLIAMLAPLSDWEVAWPDVPASPTAVHTVAVDARGYPSLDRAARDGGLGKRSLGEVRGSICVIGYPALADAVSPIRICEGLADALVLAARFEGPIVAALGTPARLATDAPLVRALAATPPGVVIHADHDQSGTGQRAASSLRLAVQAAGGTARVVHVRDGKDPADQGTKCPFPALEEGWISYAQTLREMYSTWPRSEIARQADIATQRQQEM